MGAIAPSLRSHLYVTVPAPLAVMTAEKLYVLGQAPLYDAGSTLAVTLVTANVEGLTQVSVNAAWLDVRSFGERMCRRCQPEYDAGLSDQVVVTVCAPAEPKVTV